MIQLSIFLLKDKKVWKYFLLEFYCVSINLAQHSILIPNFVLKLIIFDKVEIILNTLCNNLIKKDKGEY